MDQFCQFISISRNYHISRAQQCIDSCDVTYYSCVPHTRGENESVFYLDALLLHASHHIPFVCGQVQEMSVRLFQYSSDELIPVLDCAGIGE